MTALRIAAVAAAASALAPAARAHAQPRVEATLPAAVTTGQRVTVRGHVAGARSPLRVALDQRVAGRWRERAHARPRRGGAFALRWRAPATASVATVRVSARRGRRRIVASRTSRVAVSATQVLRPAAVTDAPPPGEPGTLRYSGRAGVEPGEFVALGVGAETPDGMLARVTAVRSGHGETVLDTVPASLVDAVPEGRLGAAAVSARLRAAAAPRAFSEAFGCGPGVGLDLDGSVALDLDPRFALDWSWGHVRQAEASVTIRGDADIAARMTAAGSCSVDDTSVARWDAPPLRFAVGPIPVVIVPRTDLFVSAEGEAGGAVETRVQGSLDATAGLRYDGDVHAIGSFDHSFAASTPTVGRYASLGARVSPSITFLMYGQAGPRFDFSTGPQLDADPEGWELSLPVELRAGLSVPHLDLLSVPQQSVFSHTFELAHGESASDERARISWDTRADVDLHVWDADGRHAWFEVNPIPGSTLSRDDTDGFGPEVFSGGPEALTYGLCLFDDKGAGPSHVTVRIDGRESTRTLSAKGDHALLGGGAFTPADGWCRPR
jgi:hypothetical protein